MKQILIILSIATLCSCGIQSNDQENKEAIISIMKAQEKAWSNNDIEEFMQGYWRNDSLKFYGGNGLTKGWEQTFENYLKRYPTKAHSGTLTFKIHDISKINNVSYWVMGEYHLKRTMGDANGIFMIIFKKINGEWKIIADTSC